MKNGQQSFEKLVKIKKHDIKHVHDYYHGLTDGCTRPPQSLQMTATTTFPLLQLLPLSATCGIVDQIMPISGQNGSACDTSDIVHVLTHVLNSPD